VDEVLSVFRQDGFAQAAVIGETAAGPARVSVI
jgi:selenide,water dikinase